MLMWRDPSCVYDSAKLELWLNGVVMSQSHLVQHNKTHRMIWVNLSMVCVPYWCPCYRLCSCLSIPIPGNEPTGRESLIDGWPDSWSSSHHGALPFNLPSKSGHGKNPCPLFDWLHRSAKLFLFSMATACACRLLKEWTAEWDKKHFWMFTSDSDNSCVVLLCTSRYSTGCCHCRWADYVHNLHRHAAGCREHELCQLRSARCALQALHPWVRHWQVPGHTVLQGLLGLGGTAECWQDNDLQDQGQSRLSVRHVMLCDLIQLLIQNGVWCQYQPPPPPYT